jgi:hypothetical protein
MDTYTNTLAALHTRGLTVTALPRLRDIDTADDAYAVAAHHPHGRFARAVRTHLPVPGRTVAAADHDHHARP